MAEAAARQRCPNCGRTHDVAVYVTGQKVTCQCGIRFEVVRHAPSRATPRLSPAKAAAASLAETVRPTEQPVDSDDALTVVSAVAPKLPGYELIEVLGRGGMGEVWRGRQLSLDRKVAVKLLAPDLAREPEFVTRFEKESAALASLSHPNIIQIIDRGRDDESGTCWFAMELFDGGSLRDRLPEKGLPADEALRLVVQICRAIEYAHARGVIHRDLKPENVLVDSSNLVKVVDFGLAGIRGDHRFDLTRSAMTMGTVNYMAPEQRRDARGVDERADIYSLGVILYELLTGDLPVGRFKLPTERLPGIDRRFDKIVSKSLEPDPEARYASASALLVELEAILGSGASRTTDPRGKGGPASRARRRKSVVGRRIWARGKWVLVGLVLAASFVALDGARDRRRTPPRPVELPGDTHGDLAVRYDRSDPDVLRVRFERGGGRLQAHSGQWQVDDGALKAWVFGDGEEGRLRPFALLPGKHLPETGTRLEASFSVDPTPPRRYDRQKPPRAALAIRTPDGGRVAFNAIFGKGAAWTLEIRQSRDSEEIRYSTEENETQLVPIRDKRLRMRLRLQDGSVEAWAGSDDAPLRRIFREPLPTGLSGNAALECEEATCTFHHLEIAPAPKPRVLAAEPDTGR